MKWELEMYCLPAMWCNFTQNNKNKINKTKLSHLKKNAQAGLLGMLPAQQEAIILYLPGRISTYKFSIVVKDLLGEPRSRVEETVHRSYIYDMQLGSEKYNKKNKTKWG